jgi:hypothetical protein
LGKDKSRTGFVIFGGVHPDRSKMLLVSALALPHLISAAKQEQQRLVSLHQSVGDERICAFVES